MQKESHQSLTRPPGKSSLKRNFTEILNQEYVCVLATVDPSGNPWVCSSFYAFMNEPEPILIFAGSDATIHAKNFLANPHAAAAIHHADMDPAHIRGLQLTGQVSALAKEDWSAREAYLQKFPFAEVYAQILLWKFSIQFAKLTDNRIRFGHKEFWQKSSSNSHS